MVDIVMLTRQPMKLIHKLNIIPTGVSGDFSAERLRLLHMLTRTFKERRRTKQS